MPSLRTGGEAIRSIHLAAYPYFFLVKVNRPFILQGTQNSGMPRQIKVVDNSCANQYFSGAIPICLIGDKAVFDKTDRRPFSNCEKLVSFVYSITVDIK
jgi:hypothetical protein